MDNPVEILQGQLDVIISGLASDKDKRSAYIHLYGVAQFSALISQKRRENTKLAVIAALLHDISAYMIPGTENHASKSSEIAHEMLSNIPCLSVDDIELICTAIKNHSYKCSIHDSLSEVLKDADVLQHWLYNIEIKISDNELERVGRLKLEFGL